MIRSVTSRPLRPALLVAGLLTIGGCGAEGGASSRWEGTVDTLASGALHVRNPARGVWTEEERWRLVEELRIGRMDARGPEQLSDVGSVEVDALGRIWVLEQDAREIRVFTSEGEHVRSFGREGEGPGEFLLPIEMFWSPAGNLWVHDVQNRRYEVFDTTGSRLTSHPVRTVGFAGGSLWGEDGRFYQWTSVRREDGFERVLEVHRLRGDELVPVDTLAPPGLPEPETFTLTASSRGNTVHLGVPVPFVHAPDLELHPAGHYWLTEGGGAYRFRKQALTGDTLLIVERPWEAVAVTDSAVDAALARFSSFGEPAGVDRGRIPDVHPPFDALHPSEDGGVWVERYRAPGEVAYDVFDPEGRYLGEVDAPLELARFTPRLITGDVVYGVWRDELDVPYVLRLRIER